VAEDAGELGHVVCALDESAIHVNESARNGKRVDLATVDDEETPVEIGATRLRGDLIAEKVDLSVRFRVVYERQLLVDLRSLFLPHLDFLLRRYPARGNADNQCEGKKDSFHVVSRDKFCPSKSKSHSKLPHSGSP